MLFVGDACRIGAVSSAKIGGLGGILEIVGECLLFSVIENVSTLYFRLSCVYIPRAGSLGVGCGFTPGVLGVGGDGGDGGLLLSVSLISS